MKNLCHKFCGFAVFSWAFLCSSCSQSAVLQSTLRSIQTNTTSATLSVPDEKTASGEWFCDEKWSVSNDIFVGTVTEITPSAKLVSDKQHEFRNRLSQFSLQNLIKFHIEKVYKDSRRNYEKSQGKIEEIEALNLRTADLAAIDFKLGEKYLLYLDKQTILKGDFLFYFVRPDSRTKLYAESTETITFFEDNYQREDSEDFWGEEGKDAVISGLVSGPAISLPKPVYPEEAKNAKLSGKIQVNVLVDETGQIIRAKAICPFHPAFAKASEEAALKAKFRPILIKGKPVKRKGVLVYNFVF